MLILKSVQAWYIMQTGDDVLLRDYELNLKLNKENYKAVINSVGSAYQHLHPDCEIRFIMRDETIAE